MLYCRLNAQTQTAGINLIERVVLLSLQNVLEHFTVDSANTRVGVVTFSTTATADINDLEPGPATDAETKCTLYARLDSLVSRHSPYGYTATHEALQTATQVVQFYRATHSM